MDVVKRMRTLSSIERFIADSQSRQPESVEELCEGSFLDYALSKTMQEAIADCGYTIPTPIQNQVIPLAIKGKDVIGIANTGTGKTASFLIPLIERTQQRELNKILILAPTRELALQIQDDWHNLSQNSGLRSVLCMGGTSMKQQVARLRSHYDFLIGTPGRVKDMMQQNMIPFSHFSAVVLDEVDRMLDMGFVRDVKAILQEVPNHRQTLFFSATLPDEIKRLCQTFTSSPVTISVKKTEYPNLVEQHLVRVDNGQRKVEILYDLLGDQQEFKKVIIFGRTKHGVKRLAGDLNRRGFKVDSLHGNKTQAARQKSLELFKKHQVTILVATDVAARGIDIDDVTHVINYDMPESIDDYIHRIGRTGRAGNTGKAFTFVD